MFLVQAAHPQSRTQKPGLDHPLCRRAGIVCPGSGVLLDGAPDTLKARELHTVGKILVTTLRCAKKSPKLL